LWCSRIWAAVRRLSWARTAISGATAAATPSADVPRITCTTCAVRSRSVCAAARPPLHGRFALRRQPWARYQRLLAQDNEGDPLRQHQRDQQVIAARQLAHQDQRRQRRVRDAAVERHPSPPARRRPDRCAGRERQAAPPGRRRRRTKAADHQRRGEGRRRCRRCRWSAYDEMIFAPHQHGQEFRRPLQAVGQPGLIRVMAICNGSASSPQQSADPAPVQAGRRAKPMTRLSAARRRSPSASPAQPRLVPFRDRQPRRQRLHARAARTERYWPAPRPATASRP